MDTTKAEFKASYGLSSQLPERDKLINSYFERGRRCALLVQLLDSRHAPSADDEMMLEYLAHHEVPFIAALTKADKLKKSQYAETAARFAEICAPYGCRGVVLTSADNGFDDRRVGYRSAGLEIRYAVVCDGRGCHPGQLPRAEKFHGRALS